MAPIREAQKHVDPTDPDQQHCKEVFCLSILDIIAVQLSKRAERAFLSRYNSRTVHAFIKSDAVQTVTGEDKVVLDRCGTAQHFRYSATLPVPRAIALDRCGTVPRHTSGTAPHFRFRVTLPVTRLTSGTAPHFRYRATLLVSRHTSGTAPLPVLRHISGTAPHLQYRATHPVPRHTFGTVPGHTSDTAPHCRYHGASRE
jgi:hypothetical protein